MARSMTYLISVSSLLFTKFLAYAEVINLSRDLYNGTVDVDFTTKALGEVDHLKIRPGPNKTVWDSWYFDAIEPTTNESIVFNFHMQAPTADLTESTSIFHVSLLGTYQNGSNFSVGLDSTDAKVIQNPDKSMSVHYFGGDEASWEGSSLLEPAPTYKISVNSTKQNVYGTLILQSRIAQPHFTCGHDQAGLSELLTPGVAWSNALPNADATVQLHVGDVNMFFKGYGYHDKTWVDRGFETEVQCAFWGHARLGPWTIVWFMVRQQDGTETSSEYLAKDGRIWTARCTKNANATRGWGDDFVYPMTPTTPHPAGMAFHWDLGEQGIFVANITGDDLYVKKEPIWVIRRGSIVGGLEGEEPMEGKDVLWTLNALPQL